MVPVYVVSCLGVLVVSYVLLLIAFGSGCLFGNGYLITACYCVTLYFCLYYCILYYYFLLYLLEWFRAWFVSGCLLVDWFIVFQV